VRKVDNRVGSELCCNNFTGTIPNEISEMSALIYLCDFCVVLWLSEPCCSELASNRLCGTIPAAIGQLINVQEL
jgi:hypothetical protein